MELKEIKELIKLVAESGVSEVEVERGDFKVSIKKAEEKIGFKAKVDVTQGIKEIYLALKAGKVDVGPKTVTVQWYRNILDAKALLDSVLLEGRVI